ncbi:MAG: hypothetical protein KDC76_10465, partial [Bacteroidetes bacterium]|nr:hypothetical protein [Bacteroidota bacterium]
MRYSLSILFVLVSLWGWSQPATDFKRLLKQANWPGTGSEIVQWGNERGVPSDAELEWHESDLNQLYNYYDSRFTNPSIFVSTYPTKKNVWTYWQFWSDALTNGSWNPRKHFKSKRAALQMARYNVLLLMAHEFGHHLAERFDVERSPLNCKEFDADRVAYALASDLEHEKSFNGYLSRYRQLLTAINAHIPSEHRFHFSDTTNLIESCSSIAVQYPSDTIQMLQYASAYFARWDFMITTKMNPDDVFSQLLWQNDREFRKKFPQITNGSVLSETEFTDHFRADFDYRFKRGVKLLGSWGESDDNIALLNSYGIDSSGNVFNVQVNANKYVSPGDLWDVRCYDTTGNLRAFWITSPPITDTFQYLEIESVAIQSVGDDLMLLVSMYNTYDQRDQRLFMLVPDAYKVRLNWIEISATLPNNIRVTPGVDGERYYMVSSTQLQPLIRFYHDSTQT